MKLGLQVVRIDFDRPAFQYRPTKELQAEAIWEETDLILAADGVKSLTRAQMLVRHGETERSQPTSKPRNFISNASMQYKTRAKQPTASY